MPRQLYKVRSSVHELLGSFSKKQIVERIKAGKYKGEEEVSAPPYTSWHKLASHPAFYDAFLKKIFQGEYHSPTAEESSVSEMSRKEVDGQSPGDPGTRRADAKTRAVIRGPGKEDDGGQGDEGAKTWNVGENRPAGGTVQQSLIDELFSEGKKLPPGEQGFAKESPERAPGTDLIRIDAPAADGTLKAEIPLPSSDIAQQDVREEESPETVARQNALRRSQNIRKSIWIGAAVVLALVFLFQMGKPTSEGNSAYQKQAYSLRPRPHTRIEDAAARDEKTKSLLDEADLLYLGDTRLSYLAALEVYRDALGYDESNPQILGRIAMTGARLLPDSPDPESLTREIRQTVDLGRAKEPQFAVFFRVEALVALYQKKADDAKRSITDALEADPNSGENALVAGEVYVGAGDRDSARPEFEESVKAQPGSARSHYLLARTAFDLHDTEKARTEGIETLKVNPLHPPTYLLLGDIATLQNQPQDARGLYETCGRLARFTTRETAAKAYFQLGSIYEAAGNAAGAQKNFRLAYYYYPQVDASLAKKVKGLDLTPAGLAKIADEAEYGKTYFHDQGDGLLKQGKINEGLKFYQAAWFLNTSDGDALVELGEVTEKTAGSYDDFRRVMNMYERAIEKSPKEAKPYIKLGLLETEQYNFDHAYKLLNQAATLEPESAAPYVALGKHFYKRQDYNEALNEFLKAAKIDSQDSEILYYAGLLRLMFRKDGAKDAVKFFYQAYTVDSTNYDALVEWLKLKVTTYEKDFAIKFVRNLIQEDPNNPNLYWAMGEVYAAARENRRAIDYYHKALDFENRNSKVRMSLARALEAIGELEKAVAEYRLSSLLDRRNSDGFFHAADLLFQMRNYNGAEEVLRFLVSVTPNYPGAHRYLSKIYDMRKQKEPAIAMMQIEVNNNPENYKFTVELAELYMEYEMYDKAVAELSRVTNLPALAKAPEYVYDKIRGYLLLSRCYRAMNKPESAEASIKLALEIDANDPELHKELGYVYYALQRDKEGVHEFEEYMRRSPAARDIDSIKALIDKMRIEE